MEKGENRWKTGFEDCPYRKGDWGMYKFNGLKKSVASRLLEISGKWGDDAIVAANVRAERPEEPDCMFCPERVDLYIYYNQFNTELNAEIMDDAVISGNWSDSDAYTFTDESVSRLKEGEGRAIRLLDGMVRLSDEMGRLLAEYAGVSEK